MKQAEGNLESCEEKKTGGEGDKAWTLYNYKVNGKYFSGFMDAKELLNKFVIVSYEENPNPKGGFYKNVKNIIEGEKPKDFKAQTQTQPTGWVRESMNLMSDKQVRSMAVSYAKDLAIARIKEESEISVDIILKVADKFAEYIKEGYLGDKDR